MKKLDRILALSDEQLIEVVATRVMGWKLLDYDSGEYAKPGDWESAASHNDGWCWEGRGGDQEAWEWNPLTSWNHCHEMESELERRGLAEDYYHQLRLLIGDAPHMLLFASPKTRCRAALLTV